MLTEGPSSRSRLIGDDGEMSVHAFSDESQRNRLYLVSAAVIDPAHLGGLRKQLRALLLPGQRELHFKKESDGRRKKIADEIATMPVEVHVYSQVCAKRADTVAARRTCLMRLMTDLLTRQAHRLVLDSRESQDTDDLRIIRRALGQRPSNTGLAYEHQDSINEPLLWIADASAWCYGAGGQWRQRISPLVTAVTEL
jgi:hypothetical protein